MPINRVDFNGKNLVDLTNDTVTPKTLAKGKTAHDKTGAVIQGEMPMETVLYTPQTLSEEQKSQARINIGADDAKTLNGFKIVVSNSEPTVNDTRIITILI